MTNILIAVQVLLVLLTIIIGRNTFFIKSLKMPVKVILILMACVPIWGVVLFVGLLWGIINKVEI